MNLLVVFIVLATVSLVDYAKGQQDVRKKIMVDVYYESLCPDSRNFILKQLKPSYPYIKNKVNLRFIPFGKSYSFEGSNGVEFSCQHGRAECDGNKLHSCVLSLLNNQEAQLNFVACDMSFGTSAESCIRKSKVDPHKVEDCLTKGQGMRLQLEAENNSKGIIGKTNFVPTIIFDNKYDRQVFHASLYEFQSLVDEVSRGY